MQAFFGVAEYVIFPTMLTSPVFCTKMLLEGKSEYPSFERTVEQMRDLLCYVCALLGMLHSSLLTDVVDALNDVGDMLRTEMEHIWRQDTEAPVKMRAALMKLLEHLLNWQSRANEDWRRHGRSHATDASVTLKLIQGVFQWVAVSTGLKPEDFERFSNLESRAQSFGAAPPVQEDSPSKQQKAGLFTRLFQEPASEYSQEKFGCETNRRPQTARTTARTTSTLGGSTCRTFRSREQIFEGDEERALCDGDEVRESGNQNGPGKARPTRLAPRKLRSGRADFSTLNEASVSPNCEAEDLGSSEEDILRNSHSRGDRLSACLSKPSKARPERLNRKASLAGVSQRSFGAGLVASPDLISKSISFGAASPSTDSSPNKEASSKDVEREPDPERDDPADFEMGTDGKVHWKEGRGPERRSHRHDDDDESYRDRPGRRGRDAGRRSPPEPEREPDPVRDDPADFEMGTDGKVHWKEGRGAERRSHREDGDYEGGKDRPGRRGRDIARLPDPDEDIVADEAKELLLADDDGHDGDAFLAFLVRRAGFVPTGLFKLASTRLSHARALLFVAVGCGGRG